MDLYGLVGAGGFGLEVMPVAAATLAAALPGSNYELVFVDEAPDLGPRINGYRVMSKASFLEHDAGDRHFNIAISDYKARQNLANELIAAGCKPFTIEARNAVVLQENEIGEGAILCPFAMVTSNARIGRFFHANIYSYVAHRCVIGDFVTFAPRVCCNGDVVVEDFAYLGTGAIIKQGTDEKPLIIGKGAVVGMGAVVTKSVAPYAVVVGNPAVPMKKKGAGR